MAAPSSIDKDRADGELWERHFTQLALSYGHTFTRHQDGRPVGAASAWGPKGQLILPDCTIWSGVGEHHEIKHKTATWKWREYGLEQYRFESLCEFARVTRDPVYYTIHDYELAGGKNATENRIEDWVTASTEMLEGKARCERGPSWVAGKLSDVLIYYWPITLFKPLRKLWEKEP